VQKRAVLAVFTTMAIVIAAGGIAASAVAAEEVAPAGTAEAPRDIVITMTDELRFDPEEIKVAAGETVRFVLENPTAAAHDFTIGSLEAQELHNAQMAAGMTHDDEADHDMEMADDEEMMMADDEADHDEEMADDEADHEHEAGLPAPVTIAPGETVTVLATFDEPGEILIGCHQPGHWEAGMRGTITIEDA
jgi:uncharacterized cupredoxin-like copper-binding protein